MSKPKPDADAMELIHGANRNLWHGIIGRKSWMIEQALKDGANPSSGPDETILESYKEAGLSADTLPLTALFLSHKRWSTIFDTRSMDFKGACRALIIKTPKRDFGVRDGMTPLLAYSQIEGGKQRHSLCKMVLRRTPAEAKSFCDDKGRNALYHFIQAGRVQDVKAAVVSGIDPAHQDAQGKNALHWECERRIRRPYKEQQNRDISLFLLRQGVPVVADHHGNHVLVLDSQIPLSAVSDMDINLPGKNGQTLASTALQHFCWTRWKELLLDPRTDWMAQVPDLGQFIKERNQRSFSNDKDAAAMYEQIVSLREQLELDHDTPHATGRLRHRF